MRLLILRASPGWLSMLLLVLAWGSVPVFAQQSTEAPCSVDKPGSGCVTAGEAPPRTLHVYANLERIPVLVLSSSRTAMKADESQFRVSLDSGREFKPDHVRVEGDDPVSFAVLIDATKPKSILLPKISESFAQLAQSSFNPSDNVSIYVMSCSLVQTAYNLTPDPSSLMKALKEALATSRAEQADHKDSCKQGIPLWDSMAVVTQQLQKLSSYRVLIAITDGHDSGSKNSWNEVRFLAQRTSVAVFGVSPVLDKLPPAPALGSMLHDALPASPFHGEDPFDIICQLSGGIQTFTGGRKLGDALVQVVQMVRNRYIVSFSEANNDQARVHSLAVTLANVDAYVRPAGLSVNLLDPELLRDPSTVPSNSTNKPVPGDRKVLSPF
jgi:hypothetical protein